MIKQFQRFLATNAFGLKITWARVLSILLVIGPPLVLSLCLVKLCVNVPFWDQWELVSLIQKLHDGTAGFSDFFAQHNEHRILFPRILMIALAYMTNWNTNYEVAANVILALCSASLLWLMLRSTLKDRRALFVPISALLSLIIFSPIQYENWMWGWQLQWFLNVLGLVLALWVLTSCKSKKIILKLIIAGLGATLATYSLASGFFVWLICLPILWMLKEYRCYVRYWIIAAVIIVGIHYIGYVDPTYHPSKFLFLKEPVQFTVYFLAYVSRPIVLDFLTSVSVGVVYLSAIFASLLFYYNNFKERIKAILPWLCLGLYSLCAAISTDMSRLGLGIEQSYANRYVTLSMLLLISFVVILAKMYELSSAKNAKLAIVIALSVIAILVFVNCIKGVQQMEARQVYLQNVEACAKNANSADDDCLLLLYPDKEKVWSRLEYLRSIHWGGL